MIIRKIYRKRDNKRTLLRFLPCAMTHELINTCCCILPDVEKFADASQQGT